MVASADGKCLRCRCITPGQRADCTQFKPVVGKIRIPRLGPGRPRRLPDSAEADKAYSSSKIRTYLRRRGIQHVIPEKTDHRTAHRKRGSRGGRPHPPASTRPATGLGTRWTGRSTS
ncbi:transposase [Streptomyces sp. NPDC001307]|uniref:transposase n=1 Tax=Streptomyces sp. NPDC001307 TaxID=3364560 RepID=UPI00369797FD